LDHQGYSATGVVGALQDVAKALFDAASYGVGGGLGLMLGFGSEITQVLGDIGAGGTIGIFAGGILLVFGGGIVLATVAGFGTAIVTNILIHQKAFPQNAYDEAVAQVFSNSLPPVERLRLTNLTGLDGRRFTVEGFDKKIYLNMGDMYHDPWPTFRVGDSAAEQAHKLDVRQTLIHELTHAWQIQHADFLPGTLCDVIHTTLDNQVGQSVYQYGPPTSPWDDFTDEAQARLVQDWFAGNANVNVPFRSPCDVHDPYFGYIRDIIRKAT
jgi:hypothetical protein